jgi:hypothetical protein
VQQKDTAGGKDEGGGMKDEKRLDALFSLPPSSFILSSSKGEMVR